MWREFIQNNTSHCHFAEPASVHAIVELEHELNITLPNDLRTLLEETNGADVSVTFPGLEDEGPMRLSLIWTVQEALKENRFFRTFDADKPAQFPPFAPLLFFASEPNGDPIAIQITNEAGIIRMSHEDYSEQTIRASSLKEYIRWFLGVLAEPRSLRGHGRSA